MILMRGCASRPQVIYPSGPMTEIVLPLSLPAPSPRLDLLEAFLAGRKATTLEAYRWDLLDFSRRIFQSADVAGSLDLFTALPAGEANGLVLCYRTKLLEANLAAATIARRLAAIRSITKLARTLGRINWTIEIQSPTPEPRRDVRGPTKDERKKVWKILGKAQGPKGKRDRAILSLLFGLALRRGEVASLDLADIDLEARTVAVVGKGKREKLRMPLSAEVVQSIEAWISIRGREPGPLFTRLDRGRAQLRMSGQSILEVTSKLGKEAGLPRKLRPHGLRHAAITSALSAGITPREVRDLSRHKKFETLFGYDDALHSATEKVAKAIGRELIFKS